MSTVMTIPRVLVFFKHNLAMVRHHWSDQVQCKFME